MMNITLPYTIENSTGEKLTFTRMYTKDGVEYLEGENEVQPGAGPPMHVHYRQIECFTILSGTIGYQVYGEEEKFASAGDTVLFKAGVPHKFWNAGKDVLRCSAYITPPDNIVYFLAQIFKSASENGGRPGMYDAAFLLNRYKSEFAMLEIPRFVQTAIFPIVRFVGNLTGKRKKFADAPPPVK